MESLCRGSSWKAWFVSQTKNRSVGSNSLARIVHNSQEMRFFGWPAWYSEQRNCLVRWPRKPLYKSAAILTKLCPQHRSCSRSVHVALGVGLPDL
jgi:hypothetical protein